MTPRGWGVRRFGRSASRRAMAALAIAATLLGPIAGAPVTAVAATPSVTLAVATTYDVLPDQARVSVTSVITATSHLHDTVTRHYTSDRAYLAVIPSGSKFRLRAASGTPSVSVASRSGTGAVLLLRFGTPLGAGQTTTLTLTFQIADPGGAPDRPLRISPSLVAFQAWAFGTDGTPGSSVRVRLPAGYEVVVGRGPLTGPTTEPDGHLDYASGPLSQPGTFAADIQADRPGDLVDHPVSATVAGRAVALDLRAWPDDPAWTARLTHVLGLGLGALAAAIGLPWRLGDSLEVRETLPPLAGGGEASAFDPAAGRLDVAYLADPTSILHGAAHAWFDGSLVADAWIAEGFAALYAERAGKAIGIAVTSPQLTPATEAPAVPLNAWQPGGSSDAFGRAAAFVVASTVADRAGDPALQAVWRDAASGVQAYQPPGTALPETGAGPPDWRSLLDLLDDHTGGSFDDVWRRWVARPTDLPLLDARLAARRQYASLLAAAGDWALPRRIRDELRTWRFDLATADMTAAAEVLAQRDRLAAITSGAGLTPPTTLRTILGGTDGLTAAAAEAATEIGVAQVLADAAAHRPASIDAWTSIGLLGAQPDADLAAARTDFTAGELEASLRLAERARTAWLTASDVARGRVVGALALVAAIALGTWLVVEVRRGRIAPPWPPRRRGRRSHAHRVAK